LFQMDRGIKELRLLIGLETHHGQALHESWRCQSDKEIISYMQWLFGQQPVKIRPQSC
jgi:hypothetical protein